MSEARTSIGSDLAFYNRRRPHSSLDGDTPLAGALSRRVAQVGDGAELFVGIDRLVDALEKAVGLDQCQPFAQIAPGDRH
jgi:hypothetical protein